MTRKTKKPAPAGKGGVPKSTPKPSRTPAHLPGQPGKGGFDKSVKHIPLPGKSRGR
ncbi:hypothetical protein [Sinisalibacter aestuarii]|uniref:Uncharacterized protein n=1 Tax=Sinisalibacter aestuarii TaxID=2949426 RepID=A0ABQ5LPT0_9RHOB|nr:hypothetical protein [Sinisalibacter aestuarii]GKY87000.1 hypothetical protein STA1M1_08690 [Sinisalibacter aestuarii]